MAKAILKIVELQNGPDDKRYRYEPASDVEDEEGTSDDESELSPASLDGPRLHLAGPVDAKFTIDNIGQISMQVQSTTKPMDVLLAPARCFNKPGDELQSSSLFAFVIQNDDRRGFESLMNMAMHFSRQKPPGDKGEEDGQCFSFPESIFECAIQHGRVTMLSQMIREFGAGISLDHLVKKSGVEMTETPRYYQGLTVYGKKK